MMAKPARMLRPDVAIVLNVLRTHTTDFADLAEHAAEKQRLISELAPGGIAILNADDPFVSIMTVPAGCPVYRFGEKSGNDIEVGEATSSWPGRLGFTMRSAGDSRRVETQLIGTQWITGAAAVMTAAKALGIPMGDAAAALAQSPPFNGRLKPVQLPVGATILRDDYNASVDSIDASLRVLENASATRRMLVISDMSDFGRNRKQRLKYLGARVAEVADAVVFVGENAEYGKRRAIDAGISEGQAHAFDSIRTAAEFLRGELREGDLVLLKGRTTDHVTRILLAQLGTVQCWKEYCSKRRLCDNCWELGFKQ